MTTRKPRNDLSAAQVRRRLHYDPETGVLTWRARTAIDIPNKRIRKSWNTRYAGTEAGSLLPTSNGEGFYRTVMWGGRRKLAHRLAWLWMTGEWPEGELDHRDGEGLNNRWLNLREASTVQNRRNARVKRTNTHGLKGVRANARKYAASITIAGRITHLGNFDTPEEAHAAYVEAARKHFGEFANPG